MPLRVRMIAKTSDWDGERAKKEIHHLAHDSRRFGRINAARTTTRVVIRLCNHVVLMEDARIIFSEDLG